MNKPKNSQAKSQAKSQARPIADLVGKCVADVFARQGFTSVELVTHWEDIVGPEISAHAEPTRLQWSRQSDPEDAEPATLVLRVEGPAAIEIQHLSGVIIERANRFFGWQAVGRVALRQAPLTRRSKRKSRPPLDPEPARLIAEGLSGFTDDALRAALGRLGAAVKRGCKRD